MRGVCLGLFLMVLGSLFAQKDIKFIQDGTSLLEQGQYEKALVEFKNAVNANSKNPEAYYQRGRCFLYLNNFTEAKRDLDKAIELAPNTAAYYNLRGAAYENMGDTVNAVKNYNKTIGIDSTDARGYISLARVFEAQNKHEDAIRIADLGIKKSVNQLTLFVIKGNVLQSLKDTTKAISAYKLALKKDSLMFGSNYALALICFERNKPKEALRFIENAIKGEPENGDGYIEKALILEELNDTIGAIAAYNKAVSIDSLNTFAYFTRGIYYKSHGNSAAAILDFSKVIRIDPTDADAYLSRGESFADTSNCEVALKDFEKAKKLTPNDPEVYFHIGLCQDETRYYREAIETFNYAIKLDSTNTQYFYSRGNTKYNLELLDDAKKDYFKALQLDSTNTGPLFNLGNIHFDRKEYENAIKYYDRYLAIETKDADAMVNRGICKNALGFEKDACEEWKKAAELGNFDAKENMKKFCK